MPRLRQLARSEVKDPGVLEQYERLFPGGRDPVKNPGTKTGTPGNWWTVFALVPDVLMHAVKGFGLYADPNRKIDPKFRELGMTRTGWLVGSQFVYSQHCKVARSVGLSDEKVANIHAWEVAGCYDDKERAVLAYTDYLVSERGRVPDPVFDKLKSFLSDEAIFELTYIVTMYDMHAIMARALKLEYDDRDDPVVEIPVPKDAPK